MRISCRWSVLIASFAVGLGSPGAAKAASFFEIRISAHDASPGDEFGFSASVSGDTAVVGAPFGDGADESSGGAYLFERNAGGIEEWGELKKLTSGDPSSGGAFGFAVAIDGGTAVVGAPFEGGAGSEAGAVYVFERDAGGIHNWGLVAKLANPDATPGTAFGHAVAISGDTVVVGAPVDDGADAEIGSAYVFERNEGGAGHWGNVARIVAMDAAVGDGFGSAVAVQGDTALVGAPRASDQSGAVYVFERSLGGADPWGQSKRLSAEDAEAGSQFGSSVSIDGDTALVGARMATARIETPRPPSPSDPTPDPSVVELEEAGAAYFFERNRGGAQSWGQVAQRFAANLQAEDQFGFAAAIRDGRAVIGSVFANANREGSAYIRERDLGGRDHWGQLEKLAGSNSRRWDEFGSSVSLSGDTIVVGAPKSDGRCPSGDPLSGTTYDRSCDSGSAYVYVRAQSAEQQRCINALNQRLLGVWSAQAGVIFKCAKDFAAQGASAEACLMEPHARIEQAEERTIRSEASKCEDPLPDFGISDAESVNEAARQLATDVMRSVLGADLDASLVPTDVNRDVAKCQQAVIQSVHKCERSRLQTFNACKRMGLRKARFREADDLEGCIDDDPRGAVARACDAARGSLAARVLPNRCVSRGVDLSSAFPGCQTDDPAQLALCVEQAVACRVCVALDQADDLALSCDLVDDASENASCP